MSNLKSIPFIKMQGAGNDFVVIDNREKFINLDQVVDLAPRLCDRRLGIGADGIILLETPTDPSLDYTMTYRNSDGSNAGMCGNGARCLALFAKGLGLGSKFIFNVHNNIYQAEIIDNEQVKIIFPMQTPVKELHIDDQRIVYQTRPGTEHIVLQVKEGDLQNEKNMRDFGSKLRHADRFKPIGTNVNFISGDSPNSLQVQTYERGVEDLTLACGTGAIASALAWHHIQDKNTTNNTYEVQVKGGNLIVGFSYQQGNDKYGDISLTGPAKQVFAGEYDV